MDTPENKPRIETIYHQLILMNQGDFSRLIPRSDKKDHLESLVVLINGANEKIRELFFDQDSTGSVTNPLLILLDNGHRIQELNTHAQEALGRNKEELWDTPFEAILTPESQILWKRTLEEIKNGTDGEREIQLSFIVQNGLLFPASFLLYYFPDRKGHKGNTVLTSLKKAAPITIPMAQLQNEIYGPFQEEGSATDTAKGHKNLHFSPDIGYIFSASRYIAQHLDEPLTLKELAQFTGTNEFKLKWGFKKVYGMSVFQYIKDMRLRKAYALILYTNDSIRSIAKLVGFKKGNHLSREFKKRYGHTPTALRIHAARSATPNFNTIHLR